MTFSCIYRTPDAFDDIVVESDGEALTGLRFAGVHCREMHDAGADACRLHVLCETFRWLDMYFGGKQPSFVPLYRLAGATPFRAEVSREMLKIPYGATTTYGEIAVKIARRHGMARMSAQAVGQAVGWNPVCIVIPCHRVMGAHGAITGYGGGIRNKAALLALEANSN